MTFHSLCSGTAVGLIRNINSPAAAGIVAWRNPDEPGQIMYLRPRKLFAAGHTVELYIGDKELGDERFWNAIEPGSEKLTGVTSLTGTVYVRVRVKNPAGVIIANELVQTILEVGAISPPSAALGLDDIVLASDGAVRTVDAAADFTGDDLTYTLVSAPDGVTIDADTGLVTIDPDQVGLVDSATVIVRASNNSGADPADSGFSLTIEAAAPAVSSASRAGSSDSAFTGPNIPSGVTAMTVALDGVDIPFGSNSISVLFSWVSTSFDAALDNRDGQRGLRITFEDNAGTKPFGGPTYTPNGALPPGPHDLAVSVSLDDGTGTARWAAFVDGVAAGSGTTASTALTTFATTRSLDLFPSGYAIDGVSRARVFGGSHAQGYTSDGDVSGLSLLAATSDMKADQFNEGTAYFTPVGAAWVIDGTSEVEPDEPSAPVGTSPVTGKVEAFGAPALADGSLYRVASDAEWDDVMNRSSAEIDGGTIEVVGTNFTRRNISDHSFTEGLRIRSADANSKLPAMGFYSSVNKLDINGLNIQVPGWPAQHPAAFNFGSGNFDDFIIRNCRVRHGYGADLVDFPTNITLPEMERINNVVQVDASPNRILPNVQDDSRGAYAVYLFNRGNAAVYVAWGDSNVEAQLGLNDDKVQNVRVPPVSEVKNGVRLNNIQTGTFFSFVSDTGIQELNIRTEMGIVPLIAAGFEAGGATGGRNLTIQNNLFTDLATGIKHVFSPKGVYVVRGNQTRRIYLDNLNSACDPNEGTMYSIDNLWHQPFSRSGIAENLNGDALDPHGDNHQMQSNGAGPLRNILSLGNIVLNDGVRDGVSSQGLFWSDNDFLPSYEDVASIGDFLAAGSPWGIAAGEGLIYGIDGFLAAGATVLWPQDDKQGTHINLSGHNGVAADCIVSGNPIANTVNSGSIFGSTKGIAQHFADFSALREAATQEELLAAGATVGEAAEKGAVYWREHALDLSEPDPTKVVKWENLRSGVSWPDYKDVAPDQLTVTDLRKVGNRKPDQVVEPGVGVEWRSVQNDKSTEAQAWTSANGTIQPGQLIQIRFTTPPGSLAKKTVAISINGFSEDIAVTTQLIIDEPKLVNGAAFTSPSNVPANVSKIEVEFDARMLSDPNDEEFFGIRKLVRLGIRQTGIRLWDIQDSTGTSVFGSSQTVGWSKTDLEQNITVRAVIDYGNDQFVLRKNDEDDIVLPFATASSGLAPSSDVMNLLSYADGGSFFGSLIFGNYRVYITQDGSRTLFKELTGTAAEVNADPWKVSAENVEDAIISTDYTPPVLSNATATRSFKKLVYSVDTTTSKGRMHAVIMKAADPEPSEYQVLTGLEVNGVKTVYAFTLDPVATTTSGQFDDVTVDTSFLPFLPDDGTEYRVSFIQFEGVRPRSNIASATFI